MSFEVRRLSAAFLCLMSFVVAPATAQDPPKLPPGLNPTSRPQLPDNWDSMSADERAKFREDMKRRMSADRTQPQGTDEERMKAMRDEKARAQADREKKIEPPADRDAVKATYTVDGKPVEIKAGEFFDTYTMLSKFDERPGAPVSEEAVFEHLLTLAEARALGFDCTVKEFEADDPLSKNQALKDSTKQLWEKTGITEDLYRRYEIDKRIVQKISDFYLNSTRVDSQGIFDAYKQNHFMYRLNYVAFTAADLQAEMQKNPPAEAELRKLWNDDKGVQNQFRTPTTVDAEFVFFDQSANGADASADAAATNSEVTAGEALAFYRRNKERLDALLTAEQRAQIEPGTKIAAGEIKTPFQFLRPQIEREIRASGRVRVAFNEAKAEPKGDLKAVADKYKLSYLKIEKGERQAFVQDPRFGLQIFGTLFNGTLGQLSSDLVTERQTQFFWRLNGKEASSLPDFDKVKDKLPAVFYEGAANQRAAEAAKAFREAIDAAGDASIKAEMDAKYAAADQNAEREIKSRNITDQKQVDEIKARHKQIALTQMTQIRNVAAGRNFETVAAAKNLKIADTGPFELMQQRFDRATSTDDASREAFLKSQPMLRSLPPNSVSQVTTDPSARAHYVYKLAERSEPDPAKISESDYLQMRANAERTGSYQVASKLMYHELSRRLNLQITAK